MQVEMISVIIIVLSMIDHRPQQSLNWYNIAMFTVLMLLLVIVGVS